ncbi:hypothetical protein V2J09_001211 [Rumex salicifolius]
MMHPYSPTQMQHVSLHRLQENSGLNNYSGQMGSFMHEDDRSYASSANADAQWQWERDAQQMSPHLHREGKCQAKGSNASLSYYQNKISDPKLGLNQESRVHLQGQDIDLGREDNSSSQTYEGLEKKFTDDIMKLTKKQLDAEDAENARHREAIALRARFATRREELLQKESQARLQQYQLTNTRHYQNDVGGQADMGPRGGYSGASGGGAFPDETQAQRSFSVRGQFNSHKQRRPPSESYGRGRMQGTDSRGPPSSGRGYNTSARYY